MVLKENTMRCSVIGIVLLKDSEEQKINLQSE